MFSRRKAAKRFSLLLLEEEESYVADWVATCKWPSNISGNWQGAAALPGRLRLCTKSLFFDPDDVRVPIVRWVSPVSLLCMQLVGSCCVCQVPQACRAAGQALGVSSARISCH